MKPKDCELNKKYKSKVNPIAHNCEYEVIKKNKTTCWVKLWDSGKPTDTIYKNVRYNVLTNNNIFHPPKTWLKIMTMF